MQEKNCIKNPTNRPQTREEKTAKLEKFFSSSHAADETRRINLKRDAEQEKEKEETRQVDPVLAEKKWEREKETSIIVHLN